LDRRINVTGEGDIGRGGKIGEHCSQEMLNSCRKIVSTKIAIENLKDTLTPMCHYGRNNIWLTDIIS
jgi:hypothetical protein